MPQGERPGRSVARGPSFPKRSCSWAFAGPWRPRSGRATAQHSWPNAGGRESPPREAACQRRQPPGGVSWRRAETSSKVQGVWHSLARAVDHDGPTLALLRPAPRAAQAAQRCWTKASRRPGGVPEPRTLAGRAAHAAALTSDNEDQGPTSIRRKTKALHHLGAHAHSAVKRSTRPRLGGKSFEAAHAPDPVVPVNLGCRPAARTSAAACAESISRT
jgi:transposase-like protein